MSELRNGLLRCKVCGGSGLKLRPGQYDPTKGEWPDYVPNCGKCKGRGEHLPPKKKRKP